MAWSWKEQKDQSKSHWEQIGCNRKIKGLQVRIEVY